MTSPSSKVILEEMLLAIKANIEYLRSEGNDNLRVKNGQLVTNLGDFFIYKFELEFFQSNVEPDAEIEVRINHNSTSGKVIAVDEKSIQIQTEKYLGTNIPEARIIITSYYLLELLYKKLEEIKDGKTSLTDLTEKTFGLIPSVTARVDTLDFQEKADLDKYKQEATKLIVGSEVSYIWGPPGTGKTQLIANIIKKFIKQNLSILLISHTNIATDGALERSVEELIHTSAYKEGKILRIGKIHKEGLKKYELVMPEKVIEQRQQPLIEEIERLNKLILLLTKEKADIEILKALENRLQGILSLITQGGDELNILKKEFEDHILKHSSSEKELNRHEQKIVNFQSMNSLKRWFSGTNLEQLSKEKVSLLNTLQGFKLKIDELENTIKTYEGKLNQLNIDKSAAEKNIQKIRLEAKNLNVDLDQINIEIKKLTEQKDALTAQLDQLSIAIINEALVIATTLTKSYSDKSVLSRQYDCVILDEASMAPLPAVWYATGLSRKKVVIVGDFFQLPPIAKYRVLKNKSKSEKDYEREEKLVDKWLKKDIFWIAGIFDAIKQKNVPKWLEQLKLQYRMHPDIAELINHINVS